MPVFHGSNDALYEHIKFARRRKLSGQPFELRLDRGCLRVMQQMGKHRHCRAEPAQPYPHLVYTLWMALDDRLVVADDLVQSCKADYLESLA